MRFVAAVGATMAAANYPVTIVRAIMDGTSRAYGLDNEFLALRNYVQVGRPSGEGVCMVNPDVVGYAVQSTPHRRAVHD